MSRPTVQKWSRDFGWVRRIQSLLSPEYYSGAIDGDFGDATEEAVRRFQVQYCAFGEGDCDGSVGEQTWAKLDEKYGADASTPLPGTSGTTGDGAAGAATESAGSGAGTVDPLGATWAPVFTAHLRTLYLALGHIDPRWASVADEEINGLGGGERVLHIAMREFAPVVIEFLGRTPTPSDVRLVAAMTQRDLSEDLAGLAAHYLLGAMESNRLGAAWFARVGPPDAAARTATASHLLRRPVSDGDRDQLADAIKFWILGG